MTGPFWLWESLYAGGLGLIIGLEREQARPAGPDEEGYLHRKGARTFTLIALYGYASALAGERHPSLPVVALLVLGLVLSALHVARRKMPGPVEDVTTEVAALGTAVLGLLVRVHLHAAVTLGLLAAAVLLAKPWSRTLVPKLRRQELSGTLQLLVALLIVVPLVPNRTLELWGPLRGVLNPRTVVVFVLLTASIGYVGYFMVRLLGPRRGLPLTGLVGGLTSSTAVTLAMGERAREAPSVAASAAVAALLACAVMMVRVVVVTAVIFPPLGLALVPPAGAMAIGYVGASVLLGRGAGAQDEPGVRLSLNNPFELGPALRFGALYVGVILGARLLSHSLGAGGLYLAAAAAGLADVDSLTLAAARLCKDGAETIPVGTTAIWIAVVTNSLVKGGLALSTGGQPYGLRVLAGHGGALLLGGLVLVWVWLRS
ncbi:MAG: DUF4010 domain-containing protein [Myxococcales bacterium]|nr:DUF4010 domain-containing protein [Myxococcota bacterium]MDW8283588.1 DUF4010 domain-containing protein [Myxococcales bacterium]